MCLYILFQWIIKTEVDICEHVSCIWWRVWIFQLTILQWWIINSRCVFFVRIRSPSLRTLNLWVSWSKTSWYVFFLYLWFLFRCNGTLSKNIWGSPWISRNIFFQSFEVWKDLFRRNWSLKWLRKNIESHLIFKKYLWVFARLWKIQIQIDSNDVFFSEEYIFWIHLKNSDSDGFRQHLWREYIFWIHLKNSDSDGFKQHLWREYIFWIHLKISDSDFRFRWIQTDSLIIFFIQKKRDSYKFKWISFRFCIFNLYRKNYYSN